MAGPGWPTTTTMKVCHSGLELYALAGDFRVHYKDDRHGKVL